MEQLTLRQIADGVGGILPSGTDAGDSFITGVSTDSRENLSGKLFIPLIGEKFDGHDFIEKAFGNGAVGCLAEKDINGGYNNNNSIIQVDSTHAAIRRLAEYYRGMFGEPAVAVTGSVGKTTAKDMIASVLGQKYKVLKTEGNFNNEIGLPLTVFKWERDHEYAVFEMGMNRFGEIRNLSRIIKPDICVITNIGVSHIENLGSREGILRAKCEIFEYMKPDGRAVLNGDDDLLLTLSDKLPNIIYYGFAPNNSVCAVDIAPDGLRGVGFTVMYGKHAVRIHAPVPGMHIVHNALGAAAVGFSAGLSPEEIARGVESFQHTKMRMDIVDTKDGITLINDAYNANPASVKAALDVLVYAPGRKVCILGDMFELGGYAEQLHAEVGRYVREKGVDLAVFTGELSRYAYDAYTGVTAPAKAHADAPLHRGLALYFENKERLLDALRGLLREGDAVLVKASRGMGFEEVSECILR